jgi:hypothetical protein
VVLGRKEEAWRLMADVMKYPYPNGWFMAVADREVDAARGEALLRAALHRWERPADSSD